MNIYFNTPSAVNDSVVISIIALISSWVALYFQFLRKTRKLILNIFPYDLSDFSTSPDVHLNIAKNKISLSNSGNTSILLVQINYETIEDETVNNKATSVYETHLFPNNLPILLKPGEAILYDVFSNTDLFLSAIKNAEITDHKAFKFNVYLRFTVVAKGKSGNYRVLIHKTQYYSPEKVHHYYSRMSNRTIDVLNVKYLL